MEKYIRELLKDHDRVIIPNFGGFLKSKGEINTLIFNEFIKFNDGQLINFVAKQEDVAIDEASSKVDEYAQQLKSRLSEGREVKIEGVGVLFTADTGRIRFNAESGDAAEKVETKKREPKAERIADKRPEKSEEAVKDSSKTVPPPPVKPAEQKKSAGIPEETDAEKKKPVPVPDEKTKKPVPVSTEKKAAVPAETAQSTVPDQKDRVTQADPRKVPPAGNKNGEKERKKRNPLLWLIPIVIVLALIVWATIDYDNMRGYFDIESSEVASTEAPETMIMKAADDGSAAETGGTETEMTPSETNEEDAAGETATDVSAATDQQEPLAAAETTEEQAVPTESETAAVEGDTKAATEVPATPPKKYHLIAGVFDEKENAAELVNKLRNEGFYAEIIGFINNKYYVSYNSFKSKTDARYEWERLRDKAYDAWLYYY